MSMQKRLIVFGCPYNSNLQFIKPHALLHKTKPDSIHNIKMFFPILSLCYGVLENTDNWHKKSVTINSETPLKLTARALLCDLHAECSWHFGFKAVAVNDSVEVGVEAEIGGT